MNCSSTSLEKTKVVATLIGADTGKVARVIEGKMTGTRSACVVDVRNGSDAFAVRLQGDIAKKIFLQSEAFYDELRILQQVPFHPNIVRLIWADENSLTIGLERAVNGDLMCCLLAERKVFERPLCQSLLKAVMHCHRCYLVHSDLKPENILLNQLGEAVVCDFARSVFAPKPINRPFRGTKAYAAPEALKGWCAISNDLWSLGVVLFCIFERAMPFDDNVLQDPNNAALDYNAEFDERLWLSSPARGLRTRVQHLLSHDPSIRPAAASLQVI